MTLRVAFLLDSLTPGGTETSTVGQLAALRDHGVEATIVVLHDRPSPLAARLGDTATPYVVMPPGNAARQVRGVRQWLRANRPDVLHTALSQADLVGRVAAVRTGVPVVAGLVSTPYAWSRADDVHVNARRLDMLRRIDAVTARHLVAGFHAVAQDAADHAVQWLGIDRSRIEVIHRGRSAAWLDPVDPDAVAAVRTELGLAADARILLAVGRREFAKGHVDLVRAMAELPDDVVCLIAGKDGQAAPEVDELIAASGLVNRVRALGPRDDIRTLLALADVFVMPSRYEGLPGALIEAMASGVPAVASDLPGIREAIGDSEAALLVPPADPPRLAAAVATILTDDDKAATMAAAGPVRFRDAFDLDVNAGRLADFHRRVAGRTKETVA